MSSRMKAAFSIVAGAAVAITVSAFHYAPHEPSQQSPRPAKPGPPGTAFWNVNQKPPANARPGDILWTQPRTDAPAGAQGWNLIYVSEIKPGIKKYVSGEVYAPKKKRRSPRDLVLWNHETTGLTDNCAPSRRSLVEDDRLRVPAIRELLDAGFVVAMSDYPGQGLPGAPYYMAGSPNARASLDVLRATRKLPTVNTSQRFVQYGWSQGGQTSMHLESTAKSYAPEFKGLGTGLIAPAVRIRDLTHRSMQIPGLAGYVIATLRGIQAFYPDLKYRDFLTPSAMEQLPVLSDGCFDIWSSASSLRHPYRPRAMARGSSWRKALTAVDAFRPAGTMPFVIYQGTDDTTTPPSLTLRERVALCGAGSQVMYNEFAGLNHSSVVPVAAERFPAWAADRFAGKPAPDNCRGS
ncbi:lipase family protein [Actinomadura sp. 3N407]|uniref:lipase family protein n=1 Tax=Actinomadura sp. 3N407 TaxID=3457423 RepID=UPI003FCCADC6